MSMKGHKHSEETKQKIRLSRLGTTQSEETRKKHSESIMGSKYSEETKQKMSKSRYGHTTSKETRDKISQSLMGHYVSDGARSKMGSNRGKTHTVSTETRKKIGDAQRNRPLPNKRGKNAYNWKGGIDSENRVARRSIEYRLWREAIYTRDNWTCQKTGIKGGKLHPHHIRNFSEYPELRFVVDNGITLSQDTHMEFHNKYGRIHNTKEQIEEFIGENYG